MKSDIKHSISFDRGQDVEYKESQVKKKCLILNKNFGIMISGTKMKKKYHSPKFLEIGWPEFTFPVTASLVLNSEAIIILHSSNLSTDSKIFQIYIS